MELTFDLLLVAQMVALGLVAGTLGGLLGVGGSTILIPGLTLLLGYNQHLYQAAAMIANVAVSVPAALRHHRAGAMSTAALRWMLPMALVFVLVGVWLSNRDVFRGDVGGLWLGRVLAVFLVYVIGVNVHRLVRPRDRSGSGPRSSQEDTGQAKLPATGNALARGVPVRRGSAAAVGVVMGTIAGMLGIGGGAVAVPLQQVALGLPLRSCIANSSAVICLSATLGAVYKNASLIEHGYDWHQSISLALLLAPSCWLGGHLGAGLTYYLPVRQVRIAFVALMVVAAVKMAAVIGT